MIYAQVQKKRSSKKQPTVTVDSDSRPFSGITQVYSPPPQYESEAPSLPPDLPPDVPLHIPPRVGRKEGFSPK